MELPWGLNEVMHIKIMVSIKCAMKESWLEPVWFCGTLLNVTWPGWEGSLEENGYRYTYGWVHCCLSETITTWSVNQLCVCVLVAQSCLILCDPMDYSPPGSPVHVILQARILNTEAGSLSFSQGIVPTQGLNLGLLHCRQILYCLNH